MENAIQKATKKAIKLAGSQTALAKVCGISAQALGQQIRKGAILPNHCITIEKQYPGEIDRYELNPAHFGHGQVSSDCVVIVLQNFQTTSKTI